MHVNMVQGAQISTKFMCTNAAGLQHPMFVTRAQQSRADGIMRGANRVVSVPLEDLDAALLGAVDGSRAQRPIVVVHAANAQTW